MKTRRRSRWAAVFATVLAIVVTGAALYARSQLPRMTIATGYAARVVCGCRYVAGRTLDSCRGDLLPGMELIRLTDDREHHAVTASVPLLIARTARYDPVLGCQLPPRVSRSSG